MKTLITLLIFAFALVLTSCEKENAPTSEYVTYDFKIVSPKKQVPLANYYLFLHQTTWVDYRTFTDTIIGYYKTNELGELKFTFKASDILKKINIEYIIENYYPDSLAFDSTNDNFKYDLFLELEENDKKVIEAYNGCSLRVTLAQEKYMAMGIDSLYLETPNERFKNINNSVYHTVGNLECSESVPLKYYYFVKGVKSKEYTKDVFISRSNPFKTETVYELEF